MLRSRVISEGVRTCLPGVIVGTYTPEELSEGAPSDTARDDAPAGGVVATVESTVEPASRLPHSVLLDHLAAIDAAATSTDLQRAHGLAYRAAYEADDIAAIKRLDAAKNGAKDRLAGAV
jgi:pyocin large subunit-like protein